jgi:2-dehydro-3-deoxyphosphogluconate aldolase / (4S)-4-hydroxy-2-oxoglutarate aldolase
MDKTPDKAQVLARIRDVGLIPILRTSSAADALTIAETLQAARLANLEIPLTVPGALKVIGKLVERFGAQMLIGAGTVLDAQAAESCVAAGASFIISPGLDLETVAFCRRAGVAVFPGALTPTEILTAWKAGADMVKLFPASAVGGAAYVRAIRAPLPQIPLIPTGGVSLDTAEAFIQAGAAALGVGSDLVDLEALRAGRPELIAEKAQRYLDLVKTARKELPDAL